MKQTGFIVVALTVCSMTLASCAAPTQSAAPSQAVPLTTAQTPATVAPSPAAPATNTPEPASTSTNTSAPTATNTPPPPTSTPVPTVTPSPTPKPTLAPTLPPLPQRTQQIDVVDQGVGQWVPQSLCLRGSTGQNHTVVVGDCHCGGVCGQSNGYLPIGYRASPLRGAPYVGNSVDGVCVMLENAQQKTTHKLMDGASVTFAQAGAEQLPDGRSKRTLAVTLVGNACQ
jgi:hypothetical protein